MNNNVSFKTNNCVAINVIDLEKPKLFYRDVLGLKLVEEKEDQLVFDAGHFLLFVDKNKDWHPPVPSFSVSDFSQAKELLLANGCEITREGKDWLWFKDPFGMVYDVIGKKII